MRPAAAALICMWLARKEGQLLPLLLLQLLPWPLLLLCSLSSQEDLLLPHSHCMTKAGDI
jgi:hypothetical protein